jgi:ubiquinone/menaquinone biosynthesis C-methylase UbiE
MQRSPANPFTSTGVVASYEVWYETTGRRADRLEKALLDRLLGRLSGIRTALEVGCGTGHFTRWLAGEGLWAVGLDISSPMLVQARRLEAAERICPYLLGDGLALPFADRTFDLVALITTLEFVSRPEQAVEEAGRVARHDVLLGVLNRHSPLALRHRWAAHRGTTVYDHAHLFTVGELGRLAREALGTRLRGLTWRTTLLPGVWPCTDSRLPWGGFIGMLLELRGADSEQDISPDKLVPAAPARTGSDHPGGLAQFPGAWSRDRSRVDEHHAVGRG